MGRFMARSIVGAVLVMAVVLCAGCASVEEPAVEQEPAVAQEPTVADQLAFPVFEWDSYLFPDELFPLRGMQPADVLHLAKHGNDTVAMLELWRRYYEGDGAVKNRSRAMHWLSEAASGGHAYAMLVIATERLSGMVIDDPEEIREAMIQQYAVVAVVATCGSELVLEIRDELGESLARMEFLDAGRQRADELFESVHGKLYCPHALRADWSSTREEVTEVESWHIALFHSMFSLQGTALDEVRGLAEDGDSTAMLELWRRYMEGDGVAVNGAQGAEWLYRAIGTGNAFAMYLMSVHVAVLTESGETFTQRQIQEMRIEAFAWMTIAATCGEPELARVRDQEAGLLDEMGWLERAQRVVTSLYSIVRDDLFCPGLLGGQEMVPLERR